MKLKINKLLVLCATFCLLLTCTITGLAEESGVQPTNQGVITLHTGNHDVTNTTFNVYKVFDVTTDGTNVSYVINSDFQRFFNEQLSVGTADNEAAYNFIKENASKTSFQSTLKTYIDGEVTPKGQLSKVDTQNKYQSTLLDYGYYVVVPSKVVDVENQLTLIFTTLFTATQNVYLKGIQPSVDKKVNDKEWESAQIGDTINFTVESVIPNMVDVTEYHYIFTDTMSEGLTIEQGKFDVKVTIGTEDVAKEKYELNVDYDKRTFSVIFNDFIQYKDKANEKITFTYSAVLNEKALSTDPATNFASIQYGNNPQELPVAGSDSVKVFTHNLLITKVDGTDENKKLKGATFELYKVVGEEKTKLNFVLSGGKYLVSSDPGANPSVISDDNGLIHIEGLNVGDYELVETKAPDGYNVLKNPVNVTITAKSGENNTVITEGNVFNVKNNAGTLLPETGGMGTVVFTVVGVVGILAVAYSFMPKKSKNK